MKSKNNPYLTNSLTTVNLFLIGFAVLITGCTAPIVAYPALSTVTPPLMAGVLIPRTITPTATATQAPSPSATATRIPSSTPRPTVTLAPATSTFTPLASPTPAPTLIPFSELEWVRIETPRSSFEIPASWYDYSGTPLKHFDNYYEYNSTVLTDEMLTPEGLGNGLVKFTYGEQTTTLAEIIHSSQTGETIDDYRQLIIDGYDAYLREVRPGDPPSASGSSGWYFGLYVNRGDRFVSMAMHCFIGYHKPEADKQQFYDYCQAIEDHIINSLIVY